MGLVAVESSNGVNSSHLIGHSYEIMLKESIDRFLDEFQRGISDFSGFSSIFFRLLQARVDPPLETIWFYAAVSSQKNSNVMEELSPLNQVIKGRDLFQFLSACSVSCNGLKSIAVLAPVLFELYRSVVALPEKKLSPKKEKKMMKEIECLIEGIVSYISICACKESDEEDCSVGLGRCFSDLVRVWTINQSKGNQEDGEVLNVFFPLISDEIRDGFSEEEIRVDYLAGVVIAQAFLLRLCLKFNAGLSKVELQKELKTLAVGSITGFRNWYFFGMLLRLLLEPTLPVSSLLGSEDEVLLRTVLYDAVILVEYSFLNPEGVAGPAADYMKDLAMRRLIVVHEATQVTRSNGDHTRAISYINAFSRSRLSSELIKWASSQTGVDQTASKLNVTTPQALIKWLLNLEHKGVKVFGNDISKFRDKLVLDMSKLDNEHLTLKHDSKVADDDLFYIDTKGDELEQQGEADQEMVESIDAAFLAAAQTVKQTVNDEKRKRKDGQKGNGKTRVKFLKYHLDENSVRKSLPSADDAEELISDEDVEEMEV